MTEDIVAIEQLLHRYCHKLDQGKAGEVAALFAENAVLIPEYEGSGEHVGRDAILAWYTRYCENLVAAVDSLRHKVSTAMIDVEGDTATSVCYLDADSVSPTNGGRTFVGGRYLDKLVRQDGKWVFRERRIIIDYQSTLSAPHT